MRRRNLREPKPVSVLLADATTQGTTGSAPISCQVKVPMFCMHGFISNTQIVTIMNHFKSMYAVVTLNRTSIIILREDAPQWTDVKSTKIEQKCYPQA